MEIEGIGINADSKRINGNLKRFDEELSVFEEFGFDYVEISPHGVDGIIHGKVNKFKINLIIDILKKHNLKYTVHAADIINLKDIFNKRIQFSSMKATIDFAHLIGARIIVYHCGSYLKYDENGAEFTEYEQRENEIESLKRLANYAAEKEIKIGVENVYQSLRSVLELVKAVDKPNVGLTLDIGHLYFWGKTRGVRYKFLDEIERAMEYTIHIHVHDNFGEPPFLYGYDIENTDTFRLTLGLGDLHMPIGWGEIPYDKVFEIIRKHRYNGVIIAEINSWERYYNALRDIPINIRRLLKGERIEIHHI